MVFDVNIKGLVSVNDLTLLTPEIVASRIQEHRRKFRIRVIIQLLGVCGVVRSRFLGASHRLEAGGLFNPLGWGPGAGDVVGRGPLARGSFLTRVDGI